MAKLSKANEREVAKARAIRIAFPGMTSDGVYARTLSAMHRCGSTVQQSAIDAVIAEDRTSHLFATHTSGALVEGF